MDESLGSRVHCIIKWDANMASITGDILYSLSVTTKCEKSLKAEISFHSESCTATQWKQL